MRKKRTLVSSSPPRLLLTFLQAKQSWVALHRHFWGEFLHDKCCNCPSITKSKLLQNVPTFLKLNSAWELIWYAFLEFDFMTAPHWNFLHVACPSHQKTQFFKPKNKQSSFFYQRMKDCTNKRASSQGKLHSIIEDKNDRKKVQCFL